MPSGIYNHNHLRKIKDKVCPQCGKKFHPKESKTKFCSMECFHEFQIGKNVNKINPMLGKHHSVSTKQILRDKRKGKYLGKDNWNWKGGLSSEHDKLRHNTENRLWRKSVLERDNWTCQKTGVKGGKLVAHHINNFTDFPELRFAIDNGITLSEKAHKEFHKIYGYKGVTYIELEKFLNR